MGVPAAVSGGQRATVRWPPAGQRRTGATPCAPCCGALRVERPRARVEAVPARHPWRHAAPRNSVFPMDAGLSRRGPHFVDAGLAPHGGFPAKPVPGKPGTYGGVCPLFCPVNAALAARGAAHFVDAGLAPHGAFPAKPRAGRARHLRGRLTALISRECGACHAGSRAFRRCGACPACGLPGEAPCRASPAPTGAFAPPCSVNATFAEQGAWHRRCGACPAWGFPGEAPCRASPAPTGAIDRSLGP